MIKKYTDLTIELQKAVKDLITECAAHDKSIVPVQFDHSLNYFPDMNSWFLCFEEEELIGVLAVFNPLSEIAEITGCVKPGKRNQGIFNALIASCRTELNRYNIATMLFVVDNTSEQGMAAINKAGLKCDHIEYLMVYLGIKEECQPAINIRAVRPDDEADFIHINSALFDETEEESKNMILSCMQSDDRKQYMAELGDEIIGICTLYYSGNKATIYGLGISEKHQGKGYGFNLINAILDLLAQQNCEVDLEVDSKNERAYNLYKKAGFKETKLVNYFIDNATPTKPVVS